MIKIVTAAVMIVTSPLAAIAAPFCLALPTGTPMCIYVDGADCAREAFRQNGSCQPNPAEVHVRPSRIGEYCLVLPSGYSTCGYANGDLCSRDALQQKGACSRSEGSLPNVLPDAYDPNAGR